MEGKNGLQVNEETWKCLDHGLTPDDEYYNENWARIIRVGWTAKGLGV